MDISNILTTHCQMASLLWTNQWPNGIVHSCLRLPVRPKRNQANRHLSRFTIGSRRARHTYKLCGLMGGNILGRENERE